MKIVLIDDDPDIVEVTSMILSSMEPFTPNTSALVNLQARALVFT